jgi:hypothetical protein
MQTFLEFLRLEETAQSRWAKSTGRSEEEVDDSMNRLRDPVHSVQNKEIPVDMMPYVQTSNGILALTDIIDDSDVGPLIKKDSYLRIITTWVWYLREFFDHYAGSYRGHFREIINLWNHVSQQDYSRLSGSIYQLFNTIMEHTTKILNFMQEKDNDPENPNSFLEYMLGKNYHFGKSQTLKRGAFEAIKHPVYRLFSILKEIDNNRERQKTPEGNTALTDEERQDAVLRLYSKGRRGMKRGKYNKDVTPEKIPNHLRNSYLARKLQRNQDPEEITNNLDQHDQYDDFYDDIEIID